MRWKTKRAKDADVIFIHENEKDIYGDIAERCQDILTTVDSPNLHAVFDPANFVEIDVEAYPYAFTLLAEYIDYLHIKDAKMGERGGIRPSWVTVALMSSCACLKSADLMALRPSNHTSRLPGETQE